MSFSDIYRDTIWQAETLTAVEKAVAETYARHARTDRQPTRIAEIASLTYPQIMAKAGISRQADVAAAVTSLVRAGWLTVERESSTGPTVYRLTIAPPTTEETRTA